MSTEPPPDAGRAQAQKTSLHPRNRHRGRYDFDQLIAASPALAEFVAINAYGDASIDFANPQAVKALNQALLLLHYGIRDWDIPPRYLCPPIPGRADHLHHAADLLGSANAGTIPRGAAVRVLDIGIGANAIYPLIGTREYGWHFVGADIDRTALDNVVRIVEANALQDAIALRQQPDPACYFNGIVRANEMFDLTLCNPPFHASLKEVMAGSKRKWQNLGKAAARPGLNFGGLGAELYCRGGEEAFITAMIAESRRYAMQCLWFTTLVSRSATLPAVYRALRGVKALKVHTIDMAQGQKKSRLVAWTFFTAGQQQAWRKARWQ